MKHCKNGRSFYQWKWMVSQAGLPRRFYCHVFSSWSWKHNETYGIWMKIVNGPGMALDIRKNCGQLWNGEGYQWNLRCTCWTRRMVSSKSLIGDRQGCRRLPWHPWCELHGKFVTHWYRQNDRNHWIQINDMIRMMHWYMFPNGSQPTFYTGLQSCVRHLCWWIAKRPLMQWPPTWSTGPCNKRSSTWIKGAMPQCCSGVEWRGLRRQVVWFVSQVRQMTSSTLAFLGPGTACSRRLHREQVLDTEHAKLVVDFGQTISPHPISL